MSASKNIQIKDIKIGKRMRALDMEKVAELAESMKLVGLIHPIMVDDSNKLVVGNHRVESAKLLGWNTISATVTKSDSILNKIIEIDENVKNNALSSIEMGEHLNERDALLTELGLRAERGDNRFTRCRGDTVSPPLQTTEAIAKEAGIGERSAQRFKQIARNIAPEVKDILRGTELAGHTRDLLEISRMEPEQQKEVVGKIVSGEAKNVSEAVGQKKFKDNAHVSHNSGENEWYTPAEYIKAARNVMGNIDLDPASSDKANKTVKAKKYYTAKSNGLSKKWSGNVWMNPPYAQPLIGDFIDKLFTEIKSGTVKQSIVLVNNATETKWFQKIASCSQAICFPVGRVRFLDEDGNPGAPLQGQAFIYSGPNVEKFVEVFNKYGLMLEVV